MVKGNWSYSGDPRKSPLDEVRYLVGDTDEANTLISDAAINYEIASVYGTTPPPNGNFLPAARVAEAIAATFTRLVDESVGDLHISYSQRAKQMRDLAVALRRRGTFAAVPITAGGQSLAEKQQQNIDPDRVKPAFAIDGMNDADGPLPNVPGEPR